MALNSSKIDDKKTNKDTFNYFFILEILVIYSSILSALARCILSDTCPYTSSVKAAEACPRFVCTVLTSSPFWSDSTAYDALSVPESINHMAKFASGIWQIHPFCEGNTRATAVFIVKFLETFGFAVYNDVFAANSWYFRNALVRASYNNLQKGIHAASEYLEMFFENLLLDAQRELKNRYLYVEYKSEVPVQSANAEISKCQNGTLDCTLEELAVLQAVKANPTITQKELAVSVGKSERTIKRRMTDPQEKGHLRRANGKRNGHWEVLVDLS